MEKIKEMIDEGALELATANGDKHEAMQYSDLKQKVDFRNQVASLSKSLSGFTIEERKRWIDEKRAEAVNEFNSGRFQSAIKVYLDSLVGIDYSIPNVKEEYQYPILLSMATCYYHQGEYQRGVALCDTILKQSHNHPMANFKKGCLLIKLGQYDQAKIHFHKAKTLADEKLAKSIDIQLSLLKKYQKSQTSIYKNMFAKEKQESTEQDQTTDFIQYSQQPAKNEPKPSKSLLQSFLSLFCPRRPSKQQ